MDESALSSDWVEYTSNSGEVIFYYNRVTKEKKWAQTLHARPVEINTDQVLCDVVKLLVGKITPGMTSGQMDNLVSLGVSMLLKRLQTKPPTERLVAASRLREFAQQILTSKQVSAGESTQFSSSVPQNVRNAQNYQIVSTNRMASAMQTVRELTFAQGNKTAVPPQIIQNNSQTSATAQGFQGVPSNNSVLGYQNDTSNSNGLTQGNIMGCTPPVIQSPREIPTHQYSYIQIPTNRGSSANQVSQPLLALATVTNNQLSQTNANQNTLRGLLTEKRHASVTSTTNAVHNQVMNSVSINFQRNNQFHSSSGTGNPTKDTRTFAPVSVSNYYDTNTSLGHFQVSGNQVHRWPGSQQYQSSPQQQVSRASFGASDRVQTYPLVGKGDGTVTRQTSHNFQNELGVNISGRKGTFQNNIPNSINNIAYTSTETQLNKGVFQNSPGSRFVGTQTFSHPAVLQTINPLSAVHQNMQPVPNSAVVDCITDRNVSKQPTHQSVVRMDSKDLNPGVVVNTALQSEQMNLLPRVASVMSLAPGSQETAPGREKQNDRPSSIKDVTANVAMTTINAATSLQRSKPNAVIINLCEDETRTGCATESVVSQNHSLNSSGEQIPITDFNKTLNEDKLEKDGHTIPKSQSENAVYSDISSVVTQITNPNEKADSVSRIPTEETEEIEKSPLGSIRIKIEPNQDQESTSCELNNQTLVDCDNVKESVETLAMGEATNNTGEEQHESAKEKNKNIVSPDKNVENFICQSRTCPAESDFSTVKTEGRSSCSVGTPDDDNNPQLQLGSNSDIISNNRISLHDQLEFSPVTIKTEFAFEPSCKLNEECEDNNSANIQDSFEASASIVPDLERVKTEPLLEEAASTSIESNDDSTLQHNLSSDKVESDTRMIPKTKASEANDAAVLPSLEVKNEISEVQPSSTLSLIAHSSDHDASTNIQEVVERDTDFQLNTTRTTVVKVECMDNSPEHLEQVMVGSDEAEEEDLERSNDSAFLEMYNLLDYLPVEKLRAIENEGDSGKDFSSIEDDAASSLDGRDVVDKMEETISSTNTIEKRKMEQASIDDSPSKKKKVDEQVSGETGAEEFYELTSDAFGSCPRSRSSSTEAVDPGQSFAALGSSLLSCGGCGMTFTEPIALQGHECAVINENFHHCGSCNKDFTNTSDLENHTSKPNKKPLHSLNSKSKGVHLNSSKYGVRNTLLQKSRLEAGELTHNMRSRGKVKKKRTESDSDVSNKKRNSHAKENVEEDLETDEAGHNQSNIENQVIEDNTCRDIDNPDTCQGKFKCQKCCKRFKNKHAFRKHERFHLKQTTSKTAKAGGIHLHKQLPEKPFKCKHCPKAFKCLSNLSRHLSRHSKGEMQCEHCGEKTTNLKNHEQRCSMREERYVCTLCQKSCDTAYKLERHKKTHEKPYQCEECDKRFSEITDLTAHQRRHSNKRPFVCNLCDKSFINKHSLQNHNKKHRDGHFPCKTCNKTFDSDDALKSHLSTHSMKTFKCKECDEEFNLSALYERHCEKHHKQSLAQGRDFKCSHCHKSYDTKYRLTRHLATHTAKKEKCSECDKLFFDKHDLKKHLRIHTGERPYKCSECSWAFPQSSQLYKHLRIQHGKGKKTSTDMHKSKGSFVCDNCSREFAEIAHLKRHFLTHTGEKPFECQFCNFAFREKHHLTRHLKSHHSGRKSKGSTLPRKEAQETVPASEDKERIISKSVSEKSVPLTATEEPSSFRGSGSQGEQKVSSPLNERKRKSRSSSVRLSQESENPFFPSQLNSPQPKPVVSKRRRTSTDYKGPTPEVCEASKKTLKLDSHATKQSIVSSADAPTSGTATKTVKQRSFQSFIPVTFQKVKQISPSKQSSNSMTDDSVNQPLDVNSIVDTMQQKSAYLNHSQHRNDQRNQQNKFNLRLIDPLPLPQSLGKKHQTPPASPRKLVTAIKDKNAISNDKMNELKRTLQLRRQLSLGTISRSDDEKQLISASKGEGQGEKSSVKQKVTRANSSLSRISTSKESSEQKSTPIKKNLSLDSQTTPQTRFMKTDSSDQMQRLSNENNAFKQKTAEQTIKTSMTEESKQISLENFLFAAKHGNKTVSNSNNSSSSNVEKLQNHRKEISNHSPKNDVPCLRLMSRPTDEKWSADDQKKGESSQVSEVTSSTEFSKRVNVEENDTGTFEDKEQLKKSSQEEDLGKREWEEDQEGKLVNETDRCETGREIGNQEKKIQQSESVSLKQKHESKRDVKEPLEVYKMHEAGVDRVKGKHVENNKSKGEKEIALQRSNVLQDSTESEATEAKQDIQEEMQNALTDCKNETNEMSLDNVKFQKQLDEEDRSEKGDKEEGEEKEGKATSGSKETKEAKEVEQREKHNSQSEHNEQKETEEHEKDGNKQAEEKENKEKEVEEKLVDRGLLEQKEDKVGQVDKVTEDLNGAKEEPHQEVEETELKYTEREERETKGIKGALSKDNIELKAVEKVYNICVDRSQQCNEVSSSIEKSPRKAQSGNHVVEKDTEKCSQRKEEAIGTLKQCAKIRSRHRNEKSSPQTSAEKRQPSERREAKRQSTVISRSNRTTSGGSRVHAYKSNVCLEHTRRTSPVRERKRHLPDANISAHSKRDSRRRRSPSPERDHKRHFHRTKSSPKDFRDGRGPLRNDDHRSESSLRYKRMPSPDPRDSRPFHRRPDKRLWRSPQRKPVTSRYTSRKRMHYYKKQETRAHLPEEFQKPLPDIPPLLPKQELQDLLLRRSSFSTDNSWTDAGRGYDKDENSGSRNCHQHQKAPSEGTHQEKNVSNMHQRPLLQQKERRPEDAEYASDDSGGRQVELYNDQRGNRIPPQRQPSQGRKAPLLPDPAPRSPPGNPYFSPVFGAPPMPQLSFRGFPVLVNDNLPGIVPLNLFFNPWNR